MTLARQNFYKQFCFDKIKWEQITEEVASFQINTNVFIQRKQKSQRAQKGENFVTQKKKKLVEIAYLHKPILNKRINP